MEEFNKKWFGHYTFDPETEKPVKHKYNWYKKALTTRPRHFTQDTCNKCRSCGIYSPICAKRNLYV